MKRNKNVFIEFDMIHYMWRKKKDDNSGIKAKKLTLESYWANGLFIYILINNLNQTKNGDTGYTIFTIFIFCDINSLFFSVLCLQLFVCAHDPRRESNCDIYMFIVVIHKYKYAYIYIYIYWQLYPVSDVDVLSMIISIGHVLIRLR